MDEEFAQQEALELACEDWCGIWEALWILNTRRPELPTHMRARLAAGALRRLADLRYITFIRVPWPGPLASVEYPDLSLDEVDAELAGQGWRQLPPASDVWFGATPEGEAAYKARDPVSLDADQDLV